MKINLTGKWDVTYQWYKDDFKKTELRLIQNGETVMGIDEGSGSSYHVEGKVEGSSLEGRYLVLASTAREDASEGEICLMIKEDGHFLDGHYTYYEGNKAIKHKYTAVKISDLPE